MSEKANHSAWVDTKRPSVLLALGWYAGGIHHGVARYAKKAGWILNIDALRTGRIPRAWQGDGVISGLGGNRWLDRAILRMKQPVVNIGPVTHPRIPNVMPDNDAIGRLAADHFHSRGFKHFAYYSRWGGLGDQLRMDAFRQHAAKPATSFHVLDVMAAGEIYDRSTTARLRWLQARLAELPKPVALMAEVDDQAMEIVQACQMSQIAVPEVVAVLGVDNDELRCDFAPVPLSSIDDNQEEQGYRAAEILDRLMAGEVYTKRTTLVQPRGVVTRKSSDILAIEHPDVASALRTIWEHYREPLTAGDVAETVPLSHRRLHDLFLRHVGRTMAEEIARRRVEHAQRLLVEGKFKITDIAGQSGFSSADRMAKIFSRLVGMSPRAYRRQHSTSPEPS